MKTLPALEWYVEAGVTSLVGSEPRNFFAEQPPAPPMQRQMQPQAQRNERAAEPMARPKANSTAAAAPVQSAGLAENIAKARQLADEATSLTALREAIMKYDGCALKKTANKTVFADGNPDTRVMLIGEAPGADEDVQGIPFCGQSGQLLDKVLFSIGRDRKAGFYITNTLFWRPPGNRKPTPEELSMCEPFLEKHIALVNPKIMLLVGATAVQQVLKTNDSMGKLRGKVFQYNNRYLQHEIPVMVTYHPSYLLRSPLNKRQAWEDMLAFDKAIKDIV